MVAKTWYMTNSLAGTAHQEMSETDPGTEANASPQTGWVVSTGATNHASMDAQSNVAAASFTATTQPDGTPVTTAGGGDCLRSTNAYTGNFASGNWVFNFSFRGVTQAGTQDGRVRFRLLKGKDPTGAGATDISGSQQQASLVTNLLTTPTQTSTLTVNPGAFEVSNEYIFVQVAWERTGAGGMTTTDVAFRIGNASGAGTRVVSADFTPTPPRTDRPDHTGVLTQPSARSRNAKQAAMTIAAAAGLFYVFPPPPLPPDPNNKGFTVGINRVVTKTLFYQAWVRPVGAPPAAPSNLTTSIEWLRPFDRAVPIRRPAQRSNVTLPAYPYEAGVVAVDEINAAASVTAHGVSTRTLFYQARIEPPWPTAAPVVVAADVAWHQPLSRPLYRARATYQNFTFVAFVAPQVTADTWLQPFGRAQRQPSRLASGSPFVSTPEVRFGVEWLQSFSRTQRQPSRPASGAPFVSTPEARQGVEWLQPFGKAQQLRRNVTDVTYAQVAPFVDNTVTIEKWKLDWNLAARTPKPLHTQPFYGFPYEGVDNSRSEWDWMQAWRGPPRLWPLAKPFQPFVPREAVLENTVTPDTWLARWQKAVPAPPARPTQPIFGYPYASVSNLTTSLEWMQAWRGPPRYTPLKSYPYQPFVPREAVVENTVTPEKWLFRFQGAPSRKARPTQPVYGFPYEAGAVPNIQWLAPLSRQAAARPVRFTPVTWNYEAAAADNTVSLEKWQQPLSLAVRRPPVWITQPLYVTSEPVAAPVEYVAASVSTSYTQRRTRFYQAWVQSPRPPGANVYAVHVTATLTLEFQRMLRYSCKAQALDGTVEQPEQSDAWVVADQAAVEGECIPAFDAEAFDDAFQICEVQVESEQSDQWASVDETASDWDEQQQIPGSGCCDED